MRATSERNVTRGIKQKTSAASVDATMQLDLFEPQNPRILIAWNEAPVADSIQDIATSADDERLVSSPTRSLYTSFPNLGLRGNSWNSFSLTPGYMLSLLRSWSIALATSTVLPTLLLQQ